MQSGLVLSFLKSKLLISVMYGTTRPYWPMQTQPNCGVATCHGQGLVTDLPHLLALNLQLTESRIYRWCVSKTITYWNFVSVSTFNIITYESTTWCCFRDFYHESIILKHLKYIVPCRFVDSMQSLAHCGSWVNFYWEMNQVSESKWSSCQKSLGRVVNIKKGPQ